METTGSWESPFIAQVYGLAQEIVCSKRCVFRSARIDLAAEDKKRIEISVNLRPLQC
jgi:hypothetical protein